MKLIFQGAMAILAISLLNSVWLGCSGLSAGEDAEKLPEISSLPWPAHGALPPCTPGSAGFDLPVIEGPSGRVVISPSAVLQPVGVDERLEIAIADPEGVGIDESAAGTLALDLGDSGSLVEVSAVVAGQAEAVVRFGAPRTYQISARFFDGDADPQEGAVGVNAFETQLPVWEMAIASEDLNSMLVAPDARIKVPAVLTVDGVSYQTEVRLHGGSSRAYPKKSFRFDLVADALPSAQNHLILRAEWNDKTMLRNYLGLEMFRNATWVQAPQAEMVHFRVNQRYYGVMWHVERIDGDFLRSRWLNAKTGSLYEADPDPVCATPGGDLTPLPSIEDYQCVYEQQKGDTAYADLIDFIENTLQLSDERFGEIIGEIMDVDSYLVYLATMAVIQNRDHIKKNYYLYRDPGVADDRWDIFPWDMELSFGHLWGEESDVLDEQMVYDDPVDFSDFRNQLMAKMLVQPRFLVRYYDFIDHIVETTFTPAFIGSRIDNILCRGAPDILADANKRADNEEYLMRVEEISRFVDERCAFILGL